jgi:hypothetical protein
MNKTNLHSMKQSSNRVTFKRLVLIGALATTVLFGSIAATAMSAESTPSWGPKWTSNGELKLPVNYHNWIFLGSPLTPNALNNGKASFPEFHNVYIHPEAYKAYHKTGEFPEGTIMLKELQR